MTRQAIQLGWLPRLKITQTSTEETTKRPAPDNRARSWYFQPAARPAGVRAL